MTDVRIERDCLGEMEIPNDQYYGIQTHRMEKVSGTANLPVIFYPDMHYALAQIKKAAAIANGKIGAMPADVSKAIAQACAMWPALKRARRCTKPPPSLTANRPPVLRLNWPPAQMRC